MKRLLWLIVALAGMAQAQTTTSVTGTIKDLTGAVVTSGQVSYTLQPGIDTTMSGIARFTPIEIDCTITGAGLVKALDGVSTCTVTNNTAQQPSGTSYKVCIQPGFIQPGSCFYWYATGGSVDITQQVPTPPGVPAYNLVDTFSNQTIAGNKTFSGSIVFGGSLTLGAITLNGNLNMGANSITNAASGTFSGNLTAAAFISASANPAGAGIFRGASSDSLVCFRNNANGANVCIKKTGALASPFPADTLDLTDFGGSKAPQFFGLGSGGQSSSSFVATANGSPGIGFNSTGGAADQKWADCFLNTTTFACRFVNDAGNTANAFLTVSRGAGAAVGSITFGAGGGVQTLPTGTGTLALVPTITLKKGSGGGSYTSASTTYVVVDATNLCYTVTIPTGWKLLINSTMPATTNTAVAAFSVALTDNASCSTANAGILTEMVSTPSVASASGSVAISYVVTGDGASHNIALQFKTSVGADSVLIQNNTATVVPVMTFLLTPSN